MNRQVWAQLKNLTSDDLVQALERDGWQRRGGSGSRRVYVKGLNMVSIHYHPGKTYGADLLRDLLQDIAWTEDDFRRLKLIK